MIKIKAAVMGKTRDVHMEEREVREPNDNEVLVKISHCGICGSDIHYYEYGRIGDFVVKNPLILGHEASGTVVKVGKKVSNVTIGDRVTIEPGHTCGTCEFCKTGRYNLCPDVVFLATPPIDGAFAEYLVYPADWVYRLPENMDNMEGALIEPFCVGLHATRMAGAKAGQTAAILGSGCIGLCTLLALSASGVKQVYVSDVIDKRLEMAKNLGGFKTINAAKEDIVEKIMKDTRGRGVDLVFETAGSEITSKQTVQIVAKGGTIVMVGMSAHPVFTFDFGLLQNKEAIIKTVFRYRNLYPAAIKIVSQCGIKLKSIVTDVYPFEDTSKALEDSISRKADMVKTVIEF